MKSKKAPKTTEPYVNPMVAKAKKIREAFTAEQFKSALASAPEAAAIIPVLHPVNTADVKQLQSRLAASEETEKAALKSYLQLREKGLDAVDDYALQVPNPNNVLGRSLANQSQRLQEARNDVASLTAQLTSVQGGLIAPALKALPAPTLERGIKPTVENPKDVTWIRVFRHVLEACVLVAAKDDVRTPLTGVHLHGDKKELHTVATNGHTLLMHATTHSDPLPAWLVAGITLPRDALAVALATIGKLADKESDDNMVSLGYAAGHAHVLVKDAEDVATFRLRAITEKYPDYQRVVEAAGSVLAGGERAALSATSVASEYLKQAAAIGAKFDAKGVTPFSSGDPKSPTVMTFMDVPGVLYLVMPVVTEAEQQMPIRTMALIGKGLSGTLAALKATQTRQKTALAGMTDVARKAAQTVIDERDQRIASVVQAMNGKALEAPKAKAEPTLAA